MNRLIGVIGIICLLISGVVHGQKRASSDYYAQIKDYNLAHLWRATKVHMDDIEGYPGTDVPFPEPLGYIGSNYQRFYIHYISVVKDTINPYRYLVTGKTRVGNNVCSFTGAITINKAVLYKPQDARDKKGVVLPFVQLILGKIVLKRVAAFLKEH